MFVNNRLLIDGSFTRRLHQTVKLLFLLTLILLCSSISAGAAGNAPDDAPFSARELEKFIRDFPGFAKWSDQKSRALDELSPDAVLDVPKLSSEAEDYLTGLGWEPPERFFVILRRVTAEILGEEAESFQPGLIKKLKEEKQKVERREDLSPDQKNKLTKDLDQALAEAERNARPQPGEVSENEKKLIDKYRNQILITLSTDVSGK